MPATDRPARPPRPPDPARSRHEPRAVRREPFPALRGQGGGRRQDGSASVELVIATPLLLLLLLGIVQFAVWEHAIHVAQAAAAEGLAAARVQGGGQAAGNNEANTVLAQVGTGVLQAPIVTTGQTAGTVTVHVRGHAEPVLPFLHLPVAATATGPIEAFLQNGAVP